MKSLSDVVFMGGADDHLVDGGINGRFDGRGHFIEGSFNALWFWCSF